MKKILLMALFLLSTTVYSSEICVLNWTHDNLREDGMPIANNEMQFEISTFGKTFKTLRGGSREYPWYEDIRCPVCSEVQIRTIDKNNPSLKSAWVDGFCPSIPTAPVMCTL